jgi:hypothetical protein
MEEYKFKKDRTLDHPFFKTQKHFICHCERQVKQRSLSHPLLNGNTYKTLSWFLSQSSLFKRKGIRCVASKFSWELTKEDNFDKLYSNLENIYTKAIDEINEIRTKNKQVVDCKILLENFSMEFGAEIVNAVECENFSKSFMDFLYSLENKPGVYFLYNDEKELIYIGKSCKLNMRLSSSIRQRNALFVRVMVTKTEADANILEPYYISLMSPPLNGDLITLDRPSFTINHDFIQSEMKEIYDLDGIIKNNSKLLDKYSKSK